MDKDKAMALGFIQRLWDNPSLHGFLPLQKEDQILQFLETNQATLITTMQSPHFFPNFQWPHIKELLLVELKELTDKQIGPLEQEIFDRHINISSLANLYEENTFSMEEALPELQDYINQLLQNFSTRKELASVITALRTEMVDRYLEQMIDIKRYVSTELFAVERLSIPLENLADLLKMIILFRPAAITLVPVESNPMNISSSMMDLLTQTLAERMKVLPKIIINSIVNSCLLYQEYPKMDCLARLAAIITHRCRNLKTGMSVDKGAEPMDKSWFSIARKNYKTYGFDPDLLFEFEYIAQSNGW